MRQPHNIVRVFIILFLFALVIILIQFFMWGNLPFSDQPNAPSIATETGFVVEIPQKALWNNYVIISAQTSPSIRCELIFVPPSGDTQKMDTVSDNDGRCVWRWKIKESYGKGSGRLIFTIDDKSETHFIEIRSSF